jgi:hypothetical protein
MPPDTVVLPGAKLTRSVLGNGDTAIVLTVACEHTPHCGTCTCGHTILITDRDAARIRALLHDHENREHA